MRNSILDAKVYDTDTDEEYTNIHLVGKQGKFVQKVRTAYEGCIEDILNVLLGYDYLLTEGLGLDWKKSIYTLNYP